MDKTLVSWHNFSILLTSSSISSSNKKDFLYSPPTTLLHKKRESFASQKQRTIESPIIKLEPLASAGAWAGDGCPLEHPHSGSNAATLRLAPISWIGGGL